MHISGWTGERGRRLLGGVVAALVAVSVAGCGAGEGSGRGGSDAPGVELPPSAAPGPAGNAQRTSISTASVQDIGAALRANGVNNPEHWAQIVVQYRPYPTNDPGLAKLRQALVQYRADPPTIDKVTNALRP